MEPSLDSEGLPDALPGTMSDTWPGESSITTTSLAPLESSPQARFTAEYHAFLNGFYPTPVPNSSMIDPIPLALGTMPVSNYNLSGANPDMVSLSSGTRSSVAVVDLPMPNPQISSAVSNPGLSQSAVNNNGIFPWHWDPAVVSASANTSAHNHLGRVQPTIRLRVSFAANGKTVATVTFSDARAIYCAT
ncbi:uncharacterized protein DSM5745_04803 [Aspergillus mulundensis]|uniref:Uncharacterized protein n=1 Tax=Aspergillus mulundensis TaxID=1810919 RepID=A0A3D8S4S0_9EURO|nr:hypothetical protein DSM5745_04803 [Aspergillus mulundensis]RDW81246.1 hypothetical protein DSM5745_04803 [Aspergillus mulundensis]